VLGGYALGSLEASPSGPWSFAVGSFETSPSSASVGARHADECRMTTIRKHEQLIVWQLGQQISQRVAEILSHSPARWDRNYCSELQEAADAISANIAEGFDRYRLPQFRYCVEIANGSLGETSTRLRQGFARKLFNECDFNELMLLCRRTRTLLARLI